MNIDRQEQQQQQQEEQKQEESASANEPWASQGKPGIKSWEEFFSTPGILRNIAESPVILTPEQREALEQGNLPENSEAWGENRMARKKKREALLHSVSTKIHADLTTQTEAETSLNSLGQKVPQREPGETPKHARERHQARIKEIAENLPINHPNDNWISILLENYKEYYPDLILEQIENTPANNTHIYNHFLQFVSDDFSPQKEYVIERICSNKNLFARIFDQHNKLAKFIENSDVHPAQRSALINTFLTNEHIAAREKGPFQEEKTRKEEIEREIARCQERLAHRAKKGLHLLIPVFLITLVLFLFIFEAVSVFDGTTIILGYMLTVVLFPSSWWLFLKYKPENPLAANIFMVAIVLFNSATIGLGIIYFASEVLGIADGVHLALLVFTPILMNLPTFILHGYRDFHIKRVEELRAIQIQPAENVVISEALAEDKKDEYVNHLQQSSELGVFPYARPEFALAQTAPTPEGGAHSAAAVSSEESSQDSSLQEPLLASSSSSSSSSTSAPSSPPTQSEPGLLNWLYSCLPGRRSAEPPSQQPLLSAADDDEDKRFGIN